MFCIVNCSNFFSCYIHFNGEESDLFANPHGFADNLLSSRYEEHTNETCKHQTRNIYTYIHIYSYIHTYIHISISQLKSRKENPQKLTQLSSRSHPRDLVGKKTAQKDTIIDITSDSQVNSNFPYRWSPASLTFNNYFYLFLYLYLT